MKFDFFTKFKGMSPANKLKWLIMAVVVICIALIFASVVTETAPPQIISKEESEDIEAKLSSTLSAIKGAGQVKVMITYEGSAQIIPAYAKNTQQSVDSGGDNLRESISTQEQVVTVAEGGQQSALIVEEKSPKVKGVIVIAQGAGDIGVKIALTQACRTILGVDSSCIEVFEMDFQK